MDGCLWSFKVLYTDMGVGISVGLGCGYPIRQIFLGARQITHGIQHGCQNLALVWGV
uniref:Uncharacterized protein n=1 Tax=Setaria italica TaxID=4555 RepID=K3Z1L3_SETIT